MSREVIGNDMDFSIACLMSNDIGKKANKFLAGMACGCLAENFARGGVEGGVKRQRSMPVVFETMPFGTSRRQRKHGVEAIQSLNSRLFIHTEHGRMPRRAHVKTDDIGGFGFEVGIIRCHVPFNSVRLQARALPDTGDGGFRNSQMRCQFTNTPVRRTIGRLAASPSQNARLQLRPAFLNCSSRMPREQTSDTSTLKALFPTTDICCVARKNLLDLSV